MLLSAVMLSNTSGSLMSSNLDLQRLPEVGSESAAAGRFLL